MSGGEKSDSAGDEGLRIHEARPGTRSWLLFAGYVANHFFRRGVTELDQAIGEGQDETPPCRGPAPGASERVRASVGSRKATR
jgi:hypothetical protein